MTFRELKDALEELEALGVSLDTTACIATSSGVTKAKSLFTNSQRELFMETRK